MGSGDETKRVYDSTNKWYSDKILKNGARSGARVTRVQRSNTSLFFSVRAEGGNSCSLPMSTGFITAMCVTVSDFIVVLNG